MSLILDALRKLERDRGNENARQTVVVLAPLPLSSGARSGWVAVVLATAAGLALGLGLLGLLTWYRTPARASAIAGPRTTPSPVAVVARPAPSPPPARRNTAEGVRASVAPPATAAPTPSAAFRLTAIGDQEGVPVAVVNDRLLHVGDALMGVRLVRIGETEVELERIADLQRFTVGF